MAREVPFLLIRVWGEAGQVYDMRHVVTARRIALARTIIRKRRLIRPKGSWEEALQYAAFRLNMSPYSLRNMLGTGRDVPRAVAYENAAYKLGFEPAQLSNMLATELSQGVSREISVGRIAQRLQVDPKKLRAVLDLETGAPCWLAIHLRHVEDFYLAGACGPVQGLAAMVQWILDHAERDEVHHRPVVGWWA